MLNEISKSFSDGDIKSFFRNGLNFMFKYSDLQDMNTINDLFINAPFCVILIEEHLNSGHWVSLMKYDNGTIEQFDSYSGRIDAELKYISNRQKTKLNEVGNRLTQLLDEYDGDVVYNHYRFQKLANGINTCGRWCVLRILMFLDGYNIDQFVKKFKWLKGLYRLKNDQLVCVLIPQ